MNVQMEFRERTRSKKPQARPLDTGLMALLKDILDKTRWSFLRVIFFTTINAVTDGARMASAFLLLPFLGVTGKNALTQKGSNLLAKLGLEFNVGNVSLLILLSFIAYAVVNLSLAWAQASQSHMYIYLWRRQLLSTYVKAKWRFYLDAPSGQLASALSQECNRLQKAAQKLSEAIGAVLVTAVYLGLALMADFGTTAILAVMAIILFAANGLLLGPLARNSRSIAGGNRRMFLITTEFLRNIKIIKSMGRADAVAVSFDKTVQAIATNLRMNSFLPSAIRTLNEMLSVLAVIATIAIALHYGLSSSPEGVLIVLALALRAASKGTTAIMALQSCSANIASFEMIKKTWREANEAVEQASASRLPPFQAKDFRNSLKFDGVSVRHGETLAVNGVSMDIAFGELVGLAGPSGAGKTTLVDALLRLFPVDGGAITVDGRPISDFELISWRQGIGYVPQEPTLIEGTIRENLMLLVPDATEAEIIAAAQKASAHDFIMEQPKGYDTLVGNMGLKLSGGQRQRLALARTLVRPPSILIMDESTSALDSLTEQRIMEAVHGLKGQMTIIIIAHRLGTIANVDRVYVLEGGRVVEQGAPAELLKNKGLFHDMWQRQAF